MMNLREACNRLSQLSHEDIAANGHLILKTWKDLTDHLRAAFTTENGHKALSEDAFVERSIQRGDDEALKRLQPQAAHDEDVVTNAGTPSTADGTSTNSTIPQVEMSSLDTTPILPVGKSSTAKSRPPKSTKSRPERALRNVQRNALKRQRVLEGSDIQNALFERVTEFPPARASGDVAGTKRHSIDSMVWYLEGFFGAMFIAEAYHAFEKEEVQHRRRRGGKPPKVYEEFAASLAVKNSKLERHIRLGDAVCKIWSSGYHGLLLLVDQHCTLRQLSVKDALNLGSWSCNDAVVRKITESLNSSVQEAYDRYREITRKHWTVEKMTATTIAITDIVEATERDSSTVSADDDANERRDGQAESGSDVGTVSTVSLYTPSHIHEDNPPFTRSPSDHPSRSSRESSRAPVGFCPDNAVGRRSIQDRATRGDFLGGMEVLVAAALDPSQLSEHHDNESSVDTSVERNSPIARPDIHGRSESEADSACPEGRDVPGTSAKHSAKRRRLNNQANSEPSDPESLGPRESVVDWSSTQTESQLAGHVRNDNCVPPGAENVFDHSTIAANDRTVAMSCPQRLYKNPTTSTAQSYAGSASLSFTLPQNASLFDKDSLSTVQPLYGGWTSASTRSGLPMMVDEWCNVSQHPGQSSANRLGEDSLALPASSVLPVMQSTNVQQTSATPGMDATALYCSITGMPLLLHQEEEEQQEGRTIHSDMVGMSFMRPWPFDQMNFSGEEEHNAGMSFMHDFAPDQFLAPQIYEISQQECTYSFQP